MLPNGIKQRDQPSPSTNLRPPPESSHSKVEQETPLVDGADKWTACADMMKKFDEDMVHGWKEDIDTSLVFAGLFSAVLTGFIVESYPSLKPDQSGQMARLLYFVAVQLTDPAMQTEDLSSISVMPSVPSSAIRINTLWFTALVCSLVVALLGILAKQWLREYLVQPSTSPKETVRLRQFRHEGLVRWRIEEIMAVLPVLLELSLVLFLVGLLDFLWTLDWTVAGVVSFLVTISLLFYAATTILPTFSLNSPFKSPQAWAMCKLARKLFPSHYHSTQFLVPEIHSVDSDMDAFFVPGSWVQRDIPLARRTGRSLDQKALIWISQQATDESCLDLLASCAVDLDSRGAASLIIEIIARRGECTASTILQSIRSQIPGLFIEIFMRRTRQAGKTKLLYMCLKLLPRMIGPSPDVCHVSMSDILYVIRKLLTEAESATCDRVHHRDALDSLALLLTRQVTPHDQDVILHLLSDLTQLGCNSEYCPEGITNVIYYASSALDRADYAGVAHACSIIMTRLPSHRCPVEDYQLSHATRCLTDLLLRYFTDRNLRRVSYDANLKIPWCIGFESIVSQGHLCDCSDLLTAFEGGVSLGLVHPEYSHAQIWDSLKPILHEKDGQSSHVKLESL